MSHDDLLLIWKSLSRELLVGFQNNICKHSRPFHRASRSPRYWHAGKCWFGAQCRFQHPGIGGVSQPTTYPPPYPPPALPMAGAADPSMFGPGPGPLGEQASRLAWTAMTPDPALLYTTTQWDWAVPPTAPAGHCHVGPALRVNGLGRRPGVVEWQRVGLADTKWESEGTNWFRREHRRQPSHDFVSVSYAASLASVYGN
jgi:hypothetical protein